MKNIYTIAIIISLTILLMVCVSGESEKKISMNSTTVNYEPSDTTSAEKLQEAANELKDLIQKKQNNKYR